jgi:hypothetical protein
VVLQIPGPFRRPVSQSINAFMAFNFLFIASELYLTFLSADTNEPAIAWR